MKKSARSLLAAPLCMLLSGAAIQPWRTEAELVAIYRAAAWIFLAAAAAVAAAWLIVSAKRRREIKRLKEQLAKIDQTPDAPSDATGEFVSRMSHEIRTPLNAIIGYNSLARSAVATAVDEPARRRAEMQVIDCLEKSEEASKHLLSVINDLLDMAAIESGKITISHERFDFKALISSATTVFYSKAKLKNVDFEVTFDALAEEWLVGDHLRVAQVLNNLLSNAVKFTPEGGKVSLLIRQPESDGSFSRIQIEVTDTGMGIPAEFLGRIWEPFEQAGNAADGDSAGAGLGLAITRRLVELMGGDIDVESELGTGTTVRVALTFGRTQQPQSSTSYDFSGINALVADDDPGTCDYIRLLFKRCGARCVTVMSGGEAVEKYIAAKREDDPFTICLVDWRMPKMDGIETVKRLREVFDDEVPVIVITAYDFDEVAERAKEAGVDMFVAKPLFQSSLFDLLSTVSGLRSPRKLAKNSDFDFGGARIILAEDNRMNIEIAKSLLVSANLNVDCAWNGREAVSLFEASPEGTYKAILMDVKMPEMDGYEATRAIRAGGREGGADIPIIAMTADAFAENIADSAEAGMNGHVSKPIDTKTLFETLQKYIGD